MEHLDICTEVIAEVNAILHYGSGNQLFSILDTEGESRVRSKMCRESIRKAAKESSADSSPTGKIERKIKYAMQHQAGNCDEMNAIAFGILTTQGLKAPLFSMADLKQDHAYTLIGDPRVPEWGETNTVVVDAWPIYGAAYTLKQSRYNLKTDPQITLTYPASTPAPESIEALFEQEYEIVNTSFVNQYLARKSAPNVGRELIESLYANTLNAKTYRDERVGAKDPSTRYQIKGEAPRTFDKISMQDLQKYRAIQEKVEPFLSTHPKWDIQQTSKRNLLSHLKSILSI
ncbi:hypothetical protein MPB2EB_1066 [Mycoavidus sp. B2-EB]|nr:hypothetical protein MPB2EB_1066 [Mycoavidus sp. B2-EB]